MALGIQQDNQASNNESFLPKEKKDVHDSTRRRRRSPMYSAMAKRRS